MRRALVLLLALGLLAGCGDDDAGGDNPAADRAAAAADELANAKSIRARFRIDSNLGGEVMTMDATGVAATDNSRGAMDGEMGFGEPPERFELVQVGEDIYLSGPFAEDLLRMTGKEWVHMREPVTPALEPREFLEFLRESPDVEEVGREEVRGRRTVRLRGPIDTAELMERAGADSIRDRFLVRPRLRRIRMVVDVWVDEQDDRLWRIGVLMTHPDAEGEMRMRADILDHGVSLDAVEAPPPGVVGELPSG